MILRATLLTLFTLLVSPGLPADPPVDATSQPVATSQVSAQNAASDATSQPHRLRDDPRYRRLWLMMIWSVVLIVIFFSAAIAIVKFSRRFTQYVTDGRQPPTPVDDIWAMHKAPENAEEYLKEEDYDGFTRFDATPNGDDADDSESDDDKNDPRNRDSFNPDEDDSENDFRRPDDEDDTDADDTDDPRLG